MIVSFLILIAICALIILAALLAIWFLQWIGCPAMPAKYITAAIWIVAGVAILVRVIRWVGVF